MKLDFRQLNALEWAVWVFPLIVIAFAVYGIVNKGWSFTASLVWRWSCFVLPILPILIGVGTYGFCKLIGYDNGSTEGFHPDGFAFGCFLLITPMYIVLALILSALAKGMRVLATLANVALGIIWYLIAANIRM